MFKKIHEDHFESEKTRKRARDLLYLTIMNGDMEEAVGAYHICQNTGQVKKMVPMIDRGKKAPWSKADTYLFGWRKN